MELQKYFSKFLLSTRKRNLSPQDILFASVLSKIIGCDIKHLNLYKEAFSIKNAGKSSRGNYERLEFLGDSILGSIISCHLYTVYPNANEGFLTQMKSKIVSRNNLNVLGEKLQLPSFIINAKGNLLSENIAGNLLESFIGAIYLDLEYEMCKKIILERILTPTHIAQLEQKIISYKSLLLEWSQKKKCEMHYQTKQLVLPDKQIHFSCEIYLHERKIANATESSKKKAEEKAAQRAFYSLNKKEKILANA